MIRDIVAFTSLYPDLRVPVEANFAYYLERARASMAPGRPFPGPFRDLEQQLSRLRGFGVVCISCVGCRPFPAGTRRDPPAPG